MSTLSNIQAAEGAPAEQTDLQVNVLLAQRRKNFRRARIAMVLIPLVAAIAQMITNAVAQRTWNFDMAAIARHVLEGVITVIGLHVLLWWAWLDRTNRPSRRGIALLLLLTLGMIVNSLVMRLDQTYFGSWARLPLGLGILSLVSFGWTNLLLTFIAILMLGGLVRYRFIDCLQAGQDAPLGRTTWSIKGMFAGTLAVALLLATLQWLRQVYANVIPAEFYPTSDLAYVLWIGLGIVADLLCLYAAAAISIGKRKLESLFLTTLSILIVLLAYAVYWSFVPGQRDLTITTVAIPVIVGTVVMVVTHWWLLRRWQQSGFQLQRSCQ